jgi:hypothetical protein
MFRLLTAALVALLLMVPQAAAQTATSSAVINGCVGKKGALRVAQKCRKGEKRLRLLALPGESGPKGEKGDPGAAGANGANGTAGAAGAAGATGSAGPAGSPDTPAQVLQKLGQVDGAGSGLDADSLDGLDSGALQRRGATTACGAGTVVNAIAATGDVTCADNPAYSPGNGLSLADGVFSVALPLLLQGQSPEPTIKAVNTNQSATVTAVMGEVSSSADGVNLTAGVAGVTGRVAQDSPGVFSTGVLGVNDGTGAVGIGVVGVHRGDGWGVFGQTFSGRGVYGLALRTSGPGVGVRGDADSPAGAGVSARYTGLGVGTALNVHDGRISVSGTDRPAFRHTATTTCGGGSFTAIDHPLVNAAPNAILLVTHTDNFDGGLIAAPDVGAVYAAAGAAVGDCPTDRWLLWSESAAEMPANAVFNVLVINQ